MPRPRRSLDREELKAVFNYDPITGDLSLKRAPKNNVKRAGEPVGHLRKDGYLSTTFKGRNFLSHVIIWYLNGGRELKPLEDIDHINGKRADNRWCNLRVITRSQNILNTTTVRGQSTTGIAGVSYNSQFLRWEAYISQHGQHKFLGYTYDMIEAAALRLAAEQCLMGFREHNSSAQKTVKAYLEGEFQVNELCPVKRKVNANNSSGITGVTRSSDSGKWIGQIKVARRNVVVYYGDSRVEAILHRLSAEQCLGIESKLRVRDVLSMADILRSAEKWTCICGVKFPQRKLKCTQCGCRKPADQMTSYYKNKLLKNKDD